MSIVQRAIFLALGLVSLAAAGLGCAGIDTDSDSEPLELESYPHPQPLSGGTSGGTNGLVNLDYQKFDYMVGIAMNEGLVTGGAPGANALTNATVVDYLLTDPAGKSVFEYAAACALAAGETVTYAGVAYVGKGHLLTTTTWLHAPLSGSARRDLLACLVAHVNPTGHHVPIALTGDNVHDDGLDHSIFSVDEALWLAVETGPAEHTEKYEKEGIYHYVWPLPVFDERCGGNAVKALTERVCGQSPKDCSLVPRTDMGACVNNGEGHYLCDGKPAIKTTLSNESYRQLYGTGYCAHQ